MAQIDLVKTLGIVINSFRYLDNQEIDYLKDEIKEIIKKTDEMNQLKESRDKQVQNLIMVVSQKQENTNEPLLSFSKPVNSEKSDEIEEDDKEEPESKTDEKKLLIDKIMGYYENIDTDADIDEIRNQLMWNNIKELKQILFNTKFTFGYTKNKNKKCLNLLKNKTVDELHTELNLVKVL